MALSVIPLWAKAAAAVVVAGIAFGAGWRLSASSWRADLAELRETYSESARLAEKAERTKERTRVDNVTQEANHAQAQSNALEPAVADGRAAADRLPVAARAAGGRACPRAAPANPVQAQPGQDPLDLLADVLHRHSRELVEVGEYADRLRIAGIACERSYQAIAAN